MLVIKILPNEKGAPNGKLADVEVHFTPDLQRGAALRALATTLRLLGEHANANTCERTAEFLDQTNPLIGLKLIGFAVWQRRGGSGRNVTFPARQYSQNGERRSFALLRPSGDDQHSQNAIRDAVLQAYDAFETAAAKS